MTKNKQFHSYDPRRLMPGHYFDLMKPIFRKLLKRVPLGPPRDSYELISYFICAFYTAGRSFLLLSISSFQIGSKIVVL